MTKEFVTHALSLATNICSAAKEAGCSHTTLRYWADKYGIEYPRRRHKPFVIPEKKRCPKCGVEKDKSAFFFNRKTLSAYCKDCQYELNLLSRKKFKQACIAYKGGKCILCSYSKSNSALEFHHRDPSKKDFAIGKKCRYTLSSQIKSELDKCDLLCSNCHRETHEELHAVLKQNQLGKLSSDVV